MYSATKIFTFDCAHMLPKHSGKCKNLHGHTYKLEVTASIIKLNPEGPNACMVVDFATLSDVVRKWIIDRLDHAYIFEGYPQERGIEQEIAIFLQDRGCKIAPLPCGTTAENLARYIYETLKQPLRDENAFLESVRLWETPTSYAEFRR